MFQEVKRIITDFSENSEMLRELEQMADTCHDNVMQKLRQDFPAMKENDIRLLCYIFTAGNQLVHERERGKHICPKIPVEVAHQSSRNAPYRSVLIPFRIDVRAVLEKDKASFHNTL